MARKNNKTTKISQPETVSSTLIVPRPLWVRLRTAATDRHVSAQSIWLLALDRYLTREGY